MTIVRISRCSTLNTNLKLYVEVYIEDIYLISKVCPSYPPRVYPRTGNKLRGG